MNERKFQRVVHLFKTFQIDYGNVENTYRKMTPKQRIEICSTINPYIDIESAMDKLLLQMSLEEVAIAYENLNDYDFNMTREMLEERLGIGGL